MTKCSWRDKPGADESCKLMADPGKQLCPRHEFLDQVRAGKRDAKDLAKAHGVGNGKPVRDRAAMCVQGYEYQGDGECAGCSKRIEWWKTPNGRRAPFDCMPHALSPSVSHFATCSKANTFRRQA